MRNHLATLVQDFERHGRQVAVVAYAGNRRVATSYAELATLAGRFSRCLAERGVLPGDRVLLWGANSAEWVAAFFGCVLRGVIAVPLDASGSAEFAATVVTDVSPRLAVGDEDLLQALPESLDKIFFQDFAATLPGQPLLQPDPSLNAATPLQIVFTSGTTSTPKGVVHTHGNVLASVDVLEREIRKYLRYERWVHPLRFLHTLPLSHVFGQFMGLWVPPLLAAEVHYEDKLVATHLIERIHRERISVAVVVPRVLELMRAALLADDAHLPQRLAALQGKSAWQRWWRLRDVHSRFGWKFWAFVSGGATLPVEVESFWTALGFVMVQGYGMTETTALATLNHPFHPASGSIGKPLPGREIRLADDGEILVRGAMLAAGTWSNGRVEPRLGDWLHTGDLGAIDADGQVRFIGRKSDVIVAASGMNIHPTDLEQAVLSQPGVRACVVVGWSGPRGAEPVAVVLAAGDVDAVGLRRLLADANAMLQEFQQIASGLLWPGEEFPRNSAGKLLRREVAAWVAQQLSGNTAALGAAPSRDPLLRLLEQVTGHAVGEAQDAADLTADVHLDSLGRMQLAAAMESQFGVAIRDASIASAATIGDLRALARTSNVAEGLAATPSTTSAGLERNSGGIGPEGPQYVRWPWSAPVQALRVVFVECLVRPLALLLAHPRVLCDADLLPKTPSIYIANHVSSMDVPLLLYALPRRVRQHMAVAMSAELLAAWRGHRAGVGVGAGPLRWLAPLQAWLVTALFNTFPLPAGAGLRRSFAHIGEALDRGYNVLIFPEGRRTEDGALQPFQSGIGLLAQDSQVEVVPMALAGLWQATQRPRLRPPGLAVAVGQPVRKTGEESHFGFAAHLRTQVQHLIHCVENR
ncbi:MAG: AMP-binding protein [Acidobacteriaceae bacterium]